MVSYLYRCQDRHETTPACTSSLLIRAACPAGSATTRSAPPARSSTTVVSVTHPWSRRAHDVAR